MCSSACSVPIHFLQLLGQVTYLPCPYLLPVKIPQLVNPLVSSLRMNSTANHVLLSPSDLSLLQYLPPAKSPPMKCPLVNCHLPAKESSGEMYFG